MYVIEVIPLRRGTQVGSLSYFGADDLEPGSIVTIPVREQFIQGVVVGTEEVSRTKTALRAATFSLKKLPPQERTQTLGDAFMKTAYTLAEYYACAPGAVIYALLPPEVRGGTMPLPHTHHIDHTEVHQPEVLYDTEAERFLAYRSLIRETFVHSGSVLLVTPTAADAQNEHQRLCSGIEDRAILLTGSGGAKAIRNAYDLLGDFTKPKLIVTTPSHALIERHDITTTIVEHAHSPHYRSRTRPYLDHRDVLRVHAKFAGRRLVFGDLLHRTEEEYFRREETYATLGEEPKRLALEGRLTLIQMKDKPHPTTSFKLFSPEVIDAVTRTVHEKGHTFLFAARRGLAPVVACIDCGYIFRSPDSGAPYSLVRIMKNGEEERWFVCGVSGHRERAADTCPACGSWRLKERGIGIQHAYDELSKVLEGRPVILFDHQSASTQKKAAFLAHKFYSTKGSVLIGTHSAFTYLTDHIDTSVVVSHDALRATPTWRQQEDTLGYLLRLRELTTGTVYVQTRTESDEIIDYATRGSVEHFYTDEIELRKQFQYPPFTVFVHLTWQGTRAQLDEAEKTIKATLAQWKPNYYSAPPTPKGEPLRYALLRIAAVDWPDTDLVRALRSLPPYVRLTINPDRIV